MNTSRIPSPRWRTLAGALLAASALAAPQLALAKAAPSAREAQLEARLEKLETEMAALRADLAAARQGEAQASAQAEAAASQAAAASQQSAATGAKLAAIEAKPAPLPPEGMRSGATTIKVGGYIKMIAANTHFGDGSVATNTLGRDFYLAQTVPVGGKASTAEDFTAKQTRLWLNMASNVAGHQVKGYVETDFQVTANAAPTITGGGSQRTTNGYTLALRRAYMQVDRWTFGQDWTNLQYVGALPESTDYVGGAEGTVFSRQPQIRYSAPLSKAMTLSLAVENPESGTATLGSPTLVENGTDHIPDFTARLAWTGARGELSLGGLVRQVRTETPGVATTTGAAVSAGGKLFFNKDKSSDLRFIVSYGHNAGRYIGLNFAPDAVYVAATGSLARVNEFAALGSLHLPLGAQLRANLMAAYQNVSYDPTLAVASLAAYNKQAWSVAGNLFYSPVKGVDLGVEYRHGERTLVSTASGTVDRIELAAKYGF